MADVKIVRNLDNNGRLVETHTYEVVTDGKRERVIETYIERVPMEMSERVVEEITPVVTTRKKEVFKDGKSVDALVEDLDQSLREFQTRMPTGGLVVEPPAPVNNTVWEYVEMGAYVILSAELAFCLYHLFLKNWF
jgi:hypothetical protein